MRLYILAILLSFTVLVAWPSSMLAADESQSYRPSFRSVKETPPKPDSSGKPGRSGGGGPDRHDYDFDKPGRPGDHHPGRADGKRPHKRDRREEERRGADAIDNQKLMYGAMPTNPLMYGIIPNPSADSKSKWKKRRPDRNHYGWGYNCYPYCDGVGLWYGDDSDDDQYDDQYDDQRGTRQYVQPPEPERSFQSGGSFEQFDDPRGTPAHDTGYPQYSGGESGPQSPAQSDIDQYHMMMKAWQ